MIPALLALVDAGILPLADAEQIDRSLDPQAARLHAEQLLTDSFARGLTAQQRRLLGTLDEAQGQPTPRALARLWAQEDELLWLSVQDDLRGVAGEQAVRASIGAVDANTWMLVNEEVVNWVDTYYTNPDAGAFGSIPNLNATSRSQFADAFQAWQLGDRTPGNYAQGLPQLINDLQPIFGRTRAEAIGVTETTRLFSQSELAAGNANPFIAAWIYSTANDSRVSELCRSGEGAIMLKGESTFSDGKGPSPRHVRCMLPGTMVVPIGPLAAVSQAFYHGPCVEITLDGGGVLSITANHPILTPDGFVEAEFLREGDDVIYASQAERIVKGVEPDGNYRPTAIEEIFRAHKESLPMLAVSVPSSAEQFHGDGRFFDGNVCIVSVNGELLHHGQSGVAQIIKGGTFDGRGMAHGPLFAHSKPLEYLLGLRDTSLRSVGIGQHGRALLRRSILPANEHRVGDIARLDTSFDDVSAKGRARHARYSREFIDRFTSEITTKKIVKIRNFDFSHYVYDLQCDMYELYIGNGVIVKNCRSSISQITGPALDALRAEGLVRERV